MMTLTLHKPDKARDADCFAPLTPVNRIDLSVDVPVGRAGDFIIAVKKLAEEFSL